LLHDHVSRAIGTDVFDPEGDRIVALALLDIFSHKPLDQEAATVGETGFSPPGASPTLEYQVGTRPDRAR
jgi:predicted ATP-dependent serine protease